MAPTRLQHPLQRLLIRQTVIGANFDQHRRWQATVPDQFLAVDERRPSPERWTRKEVVGHLIDSASNNDQRPGLTRARVRHHGDPTGARLLPRQVARLSLIKLSLTAPPPQTAKKGTQTTCRGMDFGPQR
jgi:hypothetical protein